MADQEDGPNDAELKQAEAESKRDEAENPGSGGAGFFDDADTAAAKEAGKADAEADRALNDSDADK